MAFHMKKREFRLALAAAELLYWTNTTEVDLPGLYDTERDARDELWEALQPYSQAGRIRVEPLMKHEEQAND